MIITILRRGAKFFRRQFYTLKVQRQALSSQEPLFVNGKSSVTHTTILGKNIHFNGMIISGCGTVTIGNNFHSGTQCQLIAQNHNYHGTKLPYDETYLCKDIVIEENVWLGNNVIVLGGVTIGEGAIIQAGSTVVNNIPKYAIAGGHPCRVFSQRDVEHYQTLKRQEAFF